MVLDTHRLHVHVEGSSAVVGQTTGPLNGALAVVRVTTSPDTKSQTHGGLREARAALGIVVVEGTNDIAVNQPLDHVLVPVDGVGVEGILETRHRHVADTVIGRGITLTEVVGLDLSVVATKGFLYAGNDHVSHHQASGESGGTDPVDLVEDIRFQDNAANDTSAGGSLHDHLGSTEEEVEVRVDGRGITLLVDGEDGAVVTGGDSASGRLESIEVVEVSREGRGRQTLLGLTGL